MGEQIQPKEGNESAAGGPRFFAGLAVAVGYPARVLARWSYKRRELRKLRERVWELKTTAAYGRLRREQILDGIQKLTAEKDAGRKRLEELAAEHSAEARAEKEKLKKEEEGISGALDAVKQLQKSVLADITGNMQSEAQLYERMYFIARHFNVWHDDPLPAPAPAPAEAPVDNS